jgi:transposase
MKEMMDTLEREEPVRPIGRRSGASGRKSYTREEKLRIVEEALRPGASVSRVARAYDLNTNQVFTWRRQYARGELSPLPQSAQAVALLPVEITPSAPQEKAGSVAPKPGTVELIEIELAGASLRIHGLDAHSLCQVLGQLARR